MPDDSHPHQDEYAGTDTVVHQASAPGQPPAAAARLLTRLGCASCGGTVDVQEGVTNVSCRYCDTPLAVVGERGVTRLMVLETLDLDAARQVVSRWFRSGVRKARALRRDARFEEAFLAWFPFVRARFDVIGWLLGARKERQKRGDSWVTVEVPVERQVEYPCDRTVPAAEMAEFGVQRVNLTGDQLHPLDEEQLRSRGMVFAPSRGSLEGADELTEQAIGQVRGRAGVDRVTFSWLRLIRRRITLVYYPLWVFRYTFHGRTYQVLVDAEDGTLAYGKAPGDHLYRALALVVACGGACFLGTSVLQHLSWLLRSEHGLEAIGILVLVLAGLVSWGYTQFRHGAVVEEGSGLATGKEHKTLAATLRQVREMVE